MRIISGRLGRRTLSIPKGLDVRPTTDRVREAVFNWLQSRVEFEGAAVVDLFAGSGAMGIEAYSRGAESVTFVERSARVADQIRTNLELLGITDACTVITADAMHWVGRAEDGRFDLVLADPPYDFGELEALPGMLLRLSSPGGVAVLEHGAHPGTFESHPRLKDQRKYGKTRVAYFTPESGDEEPS